MRRRRARLSILLLLVGSVLVDLLAGMLLVPRRALADVPGYVLLGAEVLAYSQVSLATVWLVFGVRSAPLPARLLGTWFVIGFWSRMLRVTVALGDWHLMSTGLAVTFLAQAAGTAAALLAFRYAGYGLADDPSGVGPRESGPQSFRFSLGSLLVTIATLSLCLATSRLVIHYPRLMELPEAFLLPMGARGLGHAAIAVSAVWAMLGSGRPAFRFAAPWAVVVCAAPLHFVTAGAPFLPGRMWTSWRELLAVTFAEAVLLLVSLAAVRASGLRLVRAEGV
jgi:hypothetical protein